MSDDTLRNRLEADKQALLEQLLAEKAVRIPERPRPRIGRTGIGRTGAGRAPLSSAQQRLWLLYELAPESTAYNLTTVLHCHGHLRPTVLHRAMEGIVARHGILRTTFHRGDDAPFQIVHPTMTVPLQVDDLSQDLPNRPAMRRDAEIQRAAAEETAWRFDLTTGPAIRVRVLRFGDAEHVLLISAHHMIYDGWSLGVFVNELAALYAADEGGLKAALAEPELDYADYVVWESRQDHGADLRYWQRQLADVPNLELPADRRRLAAPSFQGAWEPFALPRGLTDGIRDLGRRHNATLFTTLLAAFQALLHRYSGQDDFAVGVPVANRHRKELEGVIGCFVNTLAMRADFADDPTFAALLDRTRDTVMDGFSHEAAPFNSVVQAIQPERRSFETPLVQVMFSLQNAPTGRLDLPGLRLEPLKTDRRTAKFDLLFLVEETADGLDGEIEYATDLFDRETIARLAQHYRILLEAIVADPRQRVSVLPLLSRQESARLLVDWNRTATAFPADACIHELFDGEARRRPAATAITFLDQRLSYAHLQAQADRLAGHLGALGIGPGRRVALLAERSVDVIVALLAILKAGGAYVPLSPDDPDARLALLLQDVAPCVILTQSWLAARLPACECPVLHLDGILHLAADAAPDGGSPDVPPRLPTADDTAYVMYTSGSTGMPKGVCVSHRSVVRLVRDTNYAAFGPDEVLLQLAPLAFDASTFEIWGGLLNGGTVAVAPPHSLSLAEIGRCIRRHGVSTVFLTTGLFNVMVDEQLADLTPLRQLLFGGEAMSVAHVRKALRALPDCRLINCYGPTENTTFTTCHPIADLEQPGVSVPIGRPIANTRIYILDRHLQPTPIGIPGELCISGAGLAQGYFNRPELTAERFVVNPFATDPQVLDPDPRLYRTGDFCRYRPDGAIEFLGRGDQQVKIRGFRVEPNEVETVLATHPAVADVTVVPIAGRLVAYVVPDGRVGGHDATGVALRAWLAQKLPGYMVPAYMMILDRLPLNANGKVDRRRLPPPQIGVADEPGGRLTPTEEIIAGIWAKLLDRPGVGSEANFFELGGHSLLATQVISRLREAFEVELPLRAVFEAPTVAGLAQQVEAARSGAAPQPTAIRPRGDTVPAALSFAQERLWFLDQLEPGNPFYVVALALRLRGPLDSGALERSLTDIVRRHAVLRTRFPAVDGRPIQAIGDDSGITLPITDLRDLAPDAASAEAERLTIEEAGRPFDLTRGPPLRARMLHVAEGEHILLLTIHHIVADGWSLGVLVNELAPLYRAHTAGIAPALADLPIQYGDFAVWQRDWLNDVVLETQLSYWRGRLHDAPPVLDLPTDRRRPSTQSYRGSSVGFRIPPAVADGLRRLTRETGATLFMTLLAGFATLLRRYSGQDDLVIGSPIANRNRIEVEPLIGFFVNTLALRIDLRGNPSFAGLLQRVRRTALDAYAHQDLPFERLVDELQPERDLSLNPLFQVMFTLQNAPLGRLELAGVTAELLAMPHQAALFDLVLDMWEIDGTLYGTLAANADLFDDHSIRRIVDNLQTLLAAIAADAGTPLDELPLLSASEEAALLWMGAGPRRDYPVTRTLHALFADAAARDGDRIAATHNGRQITYRELDADANRIAHRLHRIGVTANGFVALLDERGIDLLAAMLGTLKAGAAFLPLDPVYPAERLGHMLSDSAAPVLISRGAYLAALPAGAFAGQALLLDADDWRSESTMPPTDTRTGGDLAYMLYTSGSTGLPKGALVRHGGAINHICAEVELLGCDQDTAFLQSAPASSDISVWQFLMPVLIGGRTVIADTATVCDGAELLRFIGAERISLIELVPVVLKELLDAASRLPAEARVLRYLKCAMVTGEAVVPALVNQWIDAYPDVPLVNAYGPTEAADDICQGVLERPIGSDRRTVPIGRPLINLTLYVLDRNLRLVPVGVPGEICVAGIGVGAGYWRNPVRTRESFVANPYAGAGEVLYRTGDIGRWLADGTLECLDRIDHQVKLRGFRIEPGEIEGVLSGYFAVREALVAIRENGAGEKLLAGYVVPDLEAPAVAAMVRELQRGQIGLWEDLHEDSYREELLRGDATFNVIGWDSNYTGEPLPEPDMREYVGFTVERIRSLRPRRVLEIGCGTGLILFALLPYCTSYAGSDLSQVAIRRLLALRDDPALRARIPGLDRAELQCRRADDGSWIEPGGHDTVVLASVVQYFPGIDYLLSVLDEVFGRVLARGGSVFIGDVRSLALLEAFHASVQVHKADAADSAAAVADRVRQRLAGEQELAIDPAFFLALRLRYPAIRAVEILPKRGIEANEMTRFRYDVLIRTAGESGRSDALAWQDWDARQHDIAALGRIFSDRRPAVLALRRVANARVTEALAVSRQVLRGQRDGRAGAIRRLAGAATGGLEPEDTWRLAHACGYRADLSMAAGYPDGSFDAVFRRLDGDDVLPLSWHGSDAPRPWSRYANNPVQEKLGHRLAPQFREFLKTMLPHYMVPASFTLLASVPTSPAGKVDREALPAPDLSGGVVAGGYVPPRTHEEQALERIWAEILALPRVGIRNNFFELGGHSLKATQVVSRIRRDLGAEVALRELFSHPTIAELAARLTEISAATGSAASMAPIPELPDSDEYPLSHAQRRLWVLSHLDGGSTAYNMPLALQIDGAIDVAAFQMAYARLVERHEILRTRFLVVDGAPRQQIGAGAALALSDLTSMPDPEAAAREIAQRDAVAPFALETGAVRASLLRLASDCHVLLLTMHHIVSDDWSQSVLVSDFVRLYTALSRGAEPDLPPLGIQYRHYAGRQNAYLAGPDAASHRAYWHGNLHGELPVLQLPTDLPRPAVKTYRGQTLGCRLDGPERAALAALARRRNASLFMVLVAVVKTLLARYTGQEDILIGFPIAGRDHPDFESQAGLYVNTLPLRDTVRRDAPFLDLLDAVTATATQAYEHQAYPLDLLVDELNLPRDVARSPMFDVIVVMQNAATPSPTIAGLAVHPFVRRYEICKFDLSFTFEERDDALQVDITYNTDLFLPARIRGMAEHFRNLVAAVLVDPGTPVGRLGLLSKAERQRLLAVATPPAPSPAPADTLVSWFEGVAARTAEDIAVVLPEDNGAARQTLGYAALNARANQLAHALRRHGIGPDVPVALCLPRTPDLVVAIIGILKAGGAYLPLDTAHPTERLVYMAEDGGAAAVVTEASLAGRFQTLGIPVICLDRDRAMLDAGLTDNPTPAAGADQLAYVIYTSGSTGQPKGVAVTHRNVVRLFTASDALFGFDARDVWTLFHSVAFDFSVWELWGALLHGGTLVIVPHAVSRAPAAFLRLLEQERVTVLNQTPSAFRQLALVDSDAAGGATGRGARPSWRLVIFGGEALDLGSLRPWFDRHGDGGPRLVNMYGITETTVHVTWRELTRADVDAQASLIGRPLPDLALAILDPYGEPVPEGVAGELYVGGAGVARGYLNRPKLSAERFIADPFGTDPQARFYRTGDLGRRRADGDIEYLGRIDQQVQIRGFRIEPGEIEAALRALPGVRDAVVLAHDRDAHMRLIGYFIPTDDMPAADGAPQVVALRRALQARLPEHMVPAQLIAVETFPFTVNGKLDRAALPRPEVRPQPTEAPYAAPEGALEQEIAAAFRSVLGIRQVGLHDNFFDLGANSLLLVQVHRALGETLGGKLNAIALFQYPTVAALAAHLGREPGTPSSAATPPPDDRGMQRRAARERRRELGR